MRLKGELHDADTAKGWTANRGQRRGLCRQRKCSEFAIILDSNLAKLKWRTMPSGSDEFPVLGSRLTLFEVKTGVGLQRESDGVEWRFWRHAGGRIIHNTAPWATGCRPVCR